MELDGIEITHPDKIIFPKKKITKGEMATYYQKIAPKILPFLKDRPLTLQRFPQGIKDNGFYQKNASDYFPDFIERVEIETEKGSNTQIICNNPKSLLYLVNQNTVTFHVWLSRKDRLYRPDQVIFDLDPSHKAFKNIKEAAKIFRKFLKDKEIDPDLRTTGQNGLHLVYSVRRTKDFEKVKVEARNMAEEITALYPKIFTTKLRKEDRNGKIFVDYLRNAYGQTAVCPFSLRANEEAGIAFPLNWKDLDTLKSASQINYATIFEKI